MNTRCKPGDLAYIRCKAKSLSGRVVAVLELAPIGCEFRLPDGFRHQALDAERAPWWICEIPADIRPPVEYKGTTSTRIASYAPIPDKHLVPLRDPGDDARDEMLRPLPEEVTA